VSHGWCGLVSERIEVTSHTSYTVIFSRPRTDLRVWAPDAKGYMVGGLEKVTYTRIWRDELDSFMMAKLSEGYQIEELKIN